MAHYLCAGIALVKRFEKPAHFGLLGSCSGVGGLAAGVQSALIAHTNGVLVVVQAVGANHPFRASGLYLSVTTDYVMVANAEVEASLAMPCINLSRGAELVGFHCRTMNDNQSNGPHDCTAIVPKTVVTTVAKYLMTLITFFQFILFFINTKFNRFLFCPFLWRKEKN
jgi:hypothetical protein